MTTGQTCSVTAGVVGVLCELTPPEGRSVYVASIRVDIDGARLKDGAVAVVERDGAVVLLHSSGTTVSVMPRHRCWPEVSGTILRFLVWGRHSPVTAALLSLDRIDPPVWPSAPETLATSTDPLH